VKLFFDNNLSYRLVGLLSDIFPNSTHAMIEGLDEAKDMTIWEYSKDNNCAVVTKDSDFLDISAVFGFPPKVVYITTGNCRLKDMENIIRDNQVTIFDFLNDNINGVLEIQA